nr:MAG TPA: hypothetical protein [Caudoviricetes sp.]
MNFAFSFFPNSVIPNVVEIISPEWGNINYISLGPFDQSCIKQIF